VGDGELRVSVDLDEGCFCNDGGGDDEANTGCDEEAARDVEGGCRENYFAMSDIQAGEELLCSYSQFAVQGGSKGFGLYNYSDTYTTYTIQNKCSMCYHHLVTIRGK
jgi:hypothetical protein